eukprot:gene16903-22392_t
MSHSNGYSLGIRDSIMIAHSFYGKEFGPAQSTHGATYTVDVEFITAELEERLNWVIDIEKSFKGKVKVTLHESHKAWASYTQDVILQ